MNPDEYGRRLDREVKKMVGPPPLLDELCGMITAIIIAAATSAPSIMTLIFLHWLLRIFWGTP